MKMRSLLLRSNSGKSAILALLIAILLLTGSSLSAHAQTTKPNGIPNNFTICTGTPVPNGYIVYQDSWDPTTCGGSTSSVTYNVQYVEPYYNVVHYGYLTVCSYAPLPSGWTQIYTTGNSQACGHSPFSTNNVEVIQRTFIGNPSINPGGVVVYPNPTGTSLAIYGFNFDNYYAPDQVLVQGFVQGSFRSFVGTVTFDNNPLWAQINATLPISLPPGTYSATVTNGNGLQSIQQLFQV